MLHKNARKSLPVVLEGALVLGLMTVTFAGEEPGMVRVINPARYETPDAIILSGLHRVREIPASAAQSMVQERRTHSTPIGIEVPEGTVEGSSTWMKGKLIRRPNDAEIAVMYFGTDEKPLFVNAGFLYPVPPDQERKPWLVYAASHTEGKHHRCEFVIASDGKNKDDLSTLREVVAIDDEQIYLNAVSQDGEEILLAAKYRFQSEPWPGRATSD
jgi:hypothetical protein